MAKCHNKITGFHGPEAVLTVVIQLGDITMTAQERQVVENKIAELKKEMNEVHGSKCEVYSRVVGYLRPVQNWNKGKKEEFAMRKTMHLGCGCDK